MSKIFFISGLGANELAFSKLGEVGREKVFIQWLSNEKDESLYDYAQRLISKYKIGKKDIVAGLSFGGLIAQEIAGILDLPQVILISSFRNKKDLRPFFKYSLKMGLHKMIPSTRIPVMDGIVANYLNSTTKRSMVAIREMLETTDYTLLSWSLDRIAEDRVITNHSLIRYNFIGNDDKIVGLWKNETTTVIDGGSHFMVYEKAEEITKLIKGILEKA